MIRKSLNKQNAKQHYRLYKKGKQWVTAMITVVSVGVGTMYITQAQVHADTTNASVTNSSTPASNATNSAPTNQTSNATSASSNVASVPSSTTNQVASSSVPSSTSATVSSVSSTPNVSSATSNLSNVPSQTTSSKNNSNSSSSNDVNNLSVNTADNQATNEDLDASMLRDGDTNSIAAGVWGTANWNLANDGTLTLENGDLQTPVHPQALNNVASQVLHIKTNHVKAPTFAGGLFAANKNGDFNQTFGNYATNSHPSGDGFVNVQDIDVSGLDTSDTTNTNRMFDTDDKLTTIYGLNTLNTDKVTDARFMFVGAHVQYLDLSHFNMKALTNTQKPLISQVDSNGNVTYTEDSPGLYGWDPQVGMFAGAKFGSVKAGVNNNIQTPDFYTNNGDHLVDQNGNEITNNDQLLALANSNNPTTYSKSVHDSLSGLIGNLQSLQTSFANRYSHGDGVASGASTAASMAETAVGIDPTAYDHQVDIFDSVATLQTLLAQSAMYQNVHVDLGDNAHDDEINAGANYLQNSGANNLASLAQAQYAQYKSTAINGVSSADSVIDSISSQAVAYNNQPYTVANDTDKLANNFRFINEINQEKAVALALQSDGANYLSQAQATLNNGKALVDSNASASTAASQSANAKQQSALDSAQTSANAALNSAQTSAQQALTSLQTSAASHAASLVNSATSQANSLNDSANQHLNHQSTTDSQSADSRANSLSDSANQHVASQSTTDSQSADSRANSLAQSIQSSAASHLASQSTTDSQSADNRANSIVNSLQSSANSHVASQSTTDSQSADSRANSLQSSATSHVASQSTTDSQSADSRANSITQSLQSSAASQIASQSTTDSLSAESRYSNLINSATIALNGLTSSATSAQKSLAISAASQHAQDTSSAQAALTQQQTQASAEQQKLNRELINEQYKIANLNATRHAVKHGQRPFIKLNTHAKLMRTTATGKVIKHLTVVQHPVLKLVNIKASHHHLVLDVIYQHHQYQMATTPDGFTYAYYDQHHIDRDHPVKLTTLKTVKAYRQPTFKHSVNTYHAGTKLTAVKMVNHHGIARFQLSNGHFVTANKYFIAVK